MLIGCKTSNSTVTTAAVTSVGAIGGAALANHLSDGDIAWTAGGAAIGAAAGFGLSYLADEQNRESFAEGYYAGKNQSAKQQYWMIQNLQNPDQWEEVSPMNTEYVPVVIPEQTVNGVTTREHIEYIEVKEPS